jgi:hypothetical protein
VGVLWQLEAHTEAKHRLDKRYLDAWWPIFLQQRWVKRVTYVDAFAGPGEYSGGEEGSPVFALASEGTVMQSQPSVHRHRSAAGCIAICRNSRQCVLSVRVG